MLSPFIIDEFRRLEEEERQRQQQPQLELELPRPIPTLLPQDEVERGVFAIELL